MNRMIAALLLMLSSASAVSAPDLNSTVLANLDRSTLEAAQQGDVLRLEPYLAPNFQAAIQVPTDAQGHVQTLMFSREEFLLYAWHALSVMQNYQVRTQTAAYRVAQDGRSATGTAVLDESLNWEGQPLRYTTRRTTHYRPGQHQIQITRLEVQVLKWDPP